ncbi:NtaA/DmoA family FMN-dependent monooxygenase [Microbacterium sp. SORGH_AS_0888]|uniref:NtaA/DmoA family FMN-dependent monooxygenase n=1 Tax=Microbacterium sp. SORGH_AS_0888 TaxID=3041791 RepID=UPI002787A245|nr:NtaA/DmoA family FMN-dependent monooxygenase [Microbacterium sp. SORGH_AS_0888]MDQ1129129.1 FMN-dependent oxidoreductase (nitrilotriacetate monooxygenase family) [Microbacterium sp. SORGH_AS_0888]
MSGGLRFGVFEVYAPQVGGTYSWAHPECDAVDYLDPERWVRMARIMDRTGYDFLFFADGFGYPMQDGDISRACLTAAINFSGLDPSTVIPVLARETERLGFVVTATTGMDHPLPLARRFATLDHLTAGRIGWNVVTGASQNAVAELFGHDGMRAHDDRYAMANEYVELARTYWEQVWDDDALVADAERGVYIEPDRIHRVDYRGDHYRSRGYFGAPPSPQRTPVIFQAGTSAQGKALAAAHAEAVFIQGTTPELTARNVADIRRLAAEAGRDPSSIRIMAGLTAIVGETAAEAERLWGEFWAMQSDEVVAALYAGNTGIDLLQLDPDGTLEQVLGTGVVGQMGTSNIERFLGTPDRPAPTVREILEELRGRGTRGFRLVGDPDAVAEGVADLAERTGLDGFLLEPVFGTRDVAAFGELVLPRLRERGLVPEPAGPTLRERMSGVAGGARLPRPASSRH